jgi:S-adenosylmethionine hydrolase
VTHGPVRVTLLTDFGTRDGYVAAMRGVIASLAPGVVVEDASHDIAPGDVAAAAWALGRYWRLYPEGTVHVVVVDPGVGGERRALAAACGRLFLVGPDNGVLTHALADSPSARVISVENPAYLLQPVSATFHGRDVFAPAAAHLAAGGTLELLGRAIDDPLLLPMPRAERDGEVIRGAIVHVDRFGNLVTNIPGAWLDMDVEVSVAEMPVGPLRPTYAAAPPGARVAVIGSAETLEIAVRDGSAQAALHVGRGAEVIVRQRRAP